MAQQGQQVNTQYLTWLIAALAALLFLLVVVPLVGMAACMGGMMAFGGGGGVFGQSGFMMLPGLLAALLLLGTVVAVILLVIRGVRRSAGPHDTDGGESPLTVLQRRYARGEIGHDEYEVQIEAERSDVPSRQARGSRL
ncbi:MAG: hypothetical protein NTZ05_03445 [Chloroflexi bacterium]|nr:hypothetical protein [Chloroflexota bacterium]